MGYNKGKKVIFSAIVLLLAIIGIWFGVESRQVKLPSLQQMNIPEQATSYRPVYAGQDWTPSHSADSSGYVPVAENDSYVLSMDPVRNTVAVREKKSGYEWNSNPSAQQLEAETVQGTLLTNLQSPFILEYAEAGSSIKNVANAFSSNVKVDRQKYGAGIQIRYQFVDLGIDLVLQYELTDTGFRAAIPAEGIRESGANHVIAIGLLPFFGAAPLSETDGYLFVPDGTGALIRFDPGRPLLGDGYYQPVYGNDVTNLRDDSNQASRQTIPYPVYGMKRGEHAFVAMITEGEYASWIRALPAGIVSTFHSIYTNFIYRQEYGQKLSKLSAPVTTFQDDMLIQDRVIEYRFLQGEHANYSGMARAYRSYLINTGQLAPRLEPVDHIPLHLWIVGGDSMSRYNKRQYVPMTTFKQAEQMVSDLLAGGVGNMLIHYYGWMDGGHDDMIKQLPVESALGGNSGAESFIQYAHQSGFKVMFEGDFVSIDKDRLGISMRSDGARNIDGTVARNPDNGSSYLNPVKSLGFMHYIVPQLRELGVDGLTHNWFGDTVFTDYRSASRSDRSQTAYDYQAALAYSRSQLGMAGVYDGNAYALKNIDTISQMAMDSSHDLIADETVPFYPMVIHGSIGYSSIPGNLRTNNTTEQFLRDIEYGAVPSFYLSAENPWKMKSADSAFLFSGQFALWKDRVIAEYQRFDQLAELYNLQMVNHEQRADGIFATTYENGTQVIVDYNTLDFKVVKGGNP